MKIAIHQPNYLPWLGYFYKIWASDKFVFHDNVEFTKKSYTKRVFIRKSPDSLSSQYLSVPLRHHSDFDLIKDLAICNNFNWQEKHINKIYYVYHRAPFFPEYFPVLKDILAKNAYGDSLSDLNSQLIIAISNLLGIETLFFSSSKLPLKVAKADVYNAEIAHFLCGDEYLSGKGAENYQSQTTYLQYGLTLRVSNFHEFISQAPPQYPTDFLPHLSILDALFYLGGKNINTIFQRCHEFESLTAHLNNTHFEKERHSTLLINR